MEVNQATLDATFIGYSVAFQSGVESAPTWSDQIAMSMPSSTRENVYAFLDRVLKMRKWLGDREVQNLATQAYRLANEKFELTVGVKREDIEDNTIGLYNADVTEMGRQAKKWPDQRMKVALQAGTSALCFDGKPFFSTTHYTDASQKTGATQVNNYTGTALTFDNFVSVKQAQAALLGRDGEPLNWGEDLVLLVPPQLEDAANLIIKAETIVRSTTVGSVTNTQRGSARVVVARELLNEATTWYLLDCSGAYKPLLWQLRYAPDFVALTSMTDENVFKRDEFLYGIRARGEAGYGLWWKAARAIA